ncbi:MAG: hypothetical protein NTX61_01495 [Bacteroidetes bacterium]|nr:hypothetical protein [Bacteroidota bacterium]
MKKLILIVCLTGFAFEVQSQYLGGTGDGFSSNSSGILTNNNQVYYCSGGTADGYGNGNTGNTTGNNQVFYCSGGSADGYGNGNTGNTTANNQVFYSSGGTGDGYDDYGYTGGMVDFSIFSSGGNGDGYTGEGTGITTLNNQYFYSSGGQGDGYDLEFTGNTTLNNQYFYCMASNGDGYDESGYIGYFQDPAIYISGGDGDGYTSGLTASVFGDQSAYCNGGIGDGYQAIAFTDSLGLGVWKGISSTNWNTASNWTFNRIPDTSVSVVVPAGCLYYPNLTAGAFYINYYGGSYKCKSLLIRDGASLTNTMGLSVYGDFSVYGQYIANNNADNSQVISNGGIIHLFSGAVMNIGNQSTTQGYCDLRVNNGGTLQMDGGILVIDDQMNVVNGGTLNMTGGILFSHWYGLGAAYSSSYPGAFYVASGASGSISGGIVKVNGKTSLSNYGSVCIYSPTFSFSGTSALDITDGVNIFSDEVELRTVTGGNFNNLLVDKPDRIVTIGSNATFTGNITINPGSTLKVSPGKNVTVQGNVVVNQ